MRFDCFAKSYHSVDTFLAHLLRADWLRDPDRSISMLCSVLTSSVPRLNCNFLSLRNCVTVADILASLYVFYIARVMPSEHLMFRLGILTAACSLYCMSSAFLVPKQGHLYILPFLRGIPCKGILTWYSLFVYFIYISFLQTFLYTSFICLFRNSFRFVRTYIYDM